MVKHASMFLMAAMVLVANVTYGGSPDGALSDHVAYYAKGQHDSVMQRSEKPELRFVNPDGTAPVSGNVVVDQLTGLMWTKDGKSPGPAACGPAEVKTWQAALEYVSCLNKVSYLGYSDWRLSDVKELKSLVSDDQRNAAAWLNAQGFNDVQANYYWSSTPDDANQQKAMCVGMVAGGVYSGPKEFNTHFVWPVRSAQ